MELTDEFLLEIVDEAYSGTVESEFFGNCEAERIRVKSIQYEHWSDQDHSDSTIIPFTERSKMILWPAYYKRFYQ